MDIDEPSRPPSARPPFPYPPNSHIAPRQNPDGSVTWETFREALGDPAAEELDRIADAAVAQSTADVQNAWRAMNQALDAWGRRTGSRKAYFAAFRRFESAAREDEKLRKLLGIW